MVYLVSSTTLDQPHNHMVMPLQGGVPGHNVVTTYAPSFTLDQYQQLLALIGTLLSSFQHNSTGQEHHMANIVGFPNNIVAGMFLNLKHSVFSTQIVNREAYNMKAWVIDIGVTDHIVCSMDLLTSIIAISHTMVQLPNGEAAIVTHVGSVQLSSYITLTNVLCVPFSPSIFCLSVP